MTDFPHAARWMEDPGVAAIVAALGECRFVGGAVRDAVAGRPVADIDLATPEEPPEAQRRLEAAGVRVFPIGKSYGVLLAVRHGRRCEVASLRRDVRTDGRRAVVAYSRDWAEDARRRDFTVNALSATPEGVLFDYCGGLDDLARRRIRFIGDPERRIREDHLRVLRYFRFVATFAGGERDPESLETALALAPLVARLSGERLCGETLRILSLPDPADVVAEMIAGGVFGHFLPAARDVERLRATIAAEARLAVAPDPERRLAALLAADDPGRLVLSGAQRRRLAALAGDGAGARRLDRETLWLEGPELFLDRLLIAGGDKRAARLLADWESPEFPLTGRDFLAAGVPKGPAVGRARRDAMAWWFARDLRPGRDECLAWLAGNAGGYRAGRPGKAP